MDSLKWFSDGLPHQVLSVDLKLIERVERSKGMDYYDFCIDLCFSDKTIKMRPIDRGDTFARFIA